MSDSTSTTSITSNSNSNSNSNTNTNSDVSANVQQAQSAGFLGSGWSFPPTFEVGNFQLNMAQQQTSIEQSINLILNTRQGERSLNPGFGSTLHSFVFRSFSSTLQSEVIEAVKVALRDYEPRVKVDSVTISVENDDSTLLAVWIEYTIRQTNSRQNHVYPFALTEATQLALNDGGL